MPRHVEIGPAPPSSPFLGAVVLTLCLASAADAAAQTGARELALTSLDDLMQIGVTSAGRQEHVRLPGPATNVKDAPNASHR